MAERPPPGYDRRDKPLPHEFFYFTDLDFNGSTAKNNLTATYLRTSGDSVDPKTIEVNPKNSAFAVETGPLIAYDSIVQKMTINKEYLMNKFASDDGVRNLKLYTWKIMGSFEDAWTPVDQVSTLDTGAILQLEDNATQKDVIPNFNNVKLVNSGNQPLSTVNDAEVFGDYGLTTNAILESSASDYQQILDTLHYGTTSAKLKSLMGNVRKYTFDSEGGKRYKSEFERRFVPKSVQFGREYLFFGEHFYMPSEDDIAAMHSTGHEASAGGHLLVKVHVRYNEWNPDFEQSRMGSS